eukprot:365012-Chlamydomonas_euryale.AAC.8
MHRRESVHACLRTSAAVAKHGSKRAASPDAQKIHEIAACCKDLPVSQPRVRTFTGTRARAPEWQVASGWSVWTVRLPQRVGAPLPPPPHASTRRRRDGACSVSAYSWFTSPPPAVRHAQPLAGVATFSTAPPPPFFSRRVLRLAGGAGSVTSRVQAQRCRSVEQRTSPRTLAAYLCCQTAACPSQ